MAKKGITYGTIQSVAIAYIVIWAISPPLEIDLIYRLFAVVATGIWVLCWVLGQNPIELDRNQIISVFFLFTVVGVTFISNGDFKGVLKQIAFFMLVICFIINNFYKDDWRDLRWLVPVVLVLFIVWNYKTIQVLIADPTIARRIVRDDEEIYVYLRQGVGGYGLVYPQVCISPAVLMWTIKAFKNNKLLFIIGAVWCVSFVRLVSLAGYSIAIFASCAGAVILFFYKGKSGLKAFFIAGLLFVAIMFSIMYIDEFRNWLLETFDGTAVAKKITDLVATGESGEAGGSIQTRMSKYSWSLSVILKYPIIGALWRGNGGGHSGLLDTIAKYGLWGGWFFIKAVYHVPNYYKEKYSESLQVRKISNAVLVTVLMVSLLNSVTYSIYCTVLLILPLFFEDVVRWESLNDENSVDS